MAIPSVIEVRAKVVECRGHWPYVMRRADVSRSWLSQFSRGQITNPTINTLTSVSVACDDVLEKLASLRA